MKKLTTLELDGTSSTGIAPTATLVEESAVQQGERHWQHQDGVVPVLPPPAAKSTDAKDVSNVQQRQASMLSGCIADRLKKLG